VLIANSDPSADKVIEALDALAAAAHRV